MVPRESAFLFLRIDSEPQLVVARESKRGSAARREDHT